VHVSEIEIREEILKFLQVNKNEKAACQNTKDTAKKEVYNDECLH
jgi:hypothetical protein